MRRRRVDVLDVVTDLIFKLMFGAAVALSVVMQDRWTY